MEPVYEKVYDLAQAYVPVSALVYDALQEDVLMEFYDTRGENRLLPQGVLDKHYADRRPHLRY